MPKLRLIALEAFTTEDSSGPDEAYLVVNGNRVWGPNSINDNGDPTGLGGVPDIEFTQSALIELYDEDTGVFDKDDRLGRVEVTADLAGKGEQRPEIKGDGAHYRLTYEVKA